MSAEPHGRARIAAVSSPGGNPPIRSLAIDETGVLRFRENGIVRHLLDDGPFDMNSIALGDFTVEDREEFAMLIGYSVGGFEELSYVRDRTYKRLMRYVEPIRQVLRSVAQAEPAERDESGIEMQERGL